MVEVSLLSSSSIELAVIAARTCYESLDKSDGLFIGSKDEALLRGIIKSGHHSVIEHIYYTFDIKGISRGCLQELARHRIASLSVKSTRYTLGKLKFAPDLTFDNFDEHLVRSGNYEVDLNSFNALKEVQNQARMGVANDILKYMIPEALKTNLIWTGNARTFRNLFELRTAVGAHWEIKELTRELFRNLPARHKLLYEDLL